MDNSMTDIMENKTKSEWGMDTMMRHTISPQTAWFHWATQDLITSSLLCAYFLQKTLDFIKLKQIYKV